VQTVLRKIAAGSGSQRLCPGAVRFVGQQPDNGSARVDLSNLSDSCDTPSQGEVQIHDYYVGPMRAEQFDRFVRLGRGCNHLHVGLQVYQKGKTVTEQWIVIYDEDLNLRWEHTFDRLKRKSFWICRKTDASTPLISGGFQN